MYQKALTASGRICFALSITKQSKVTPASYAMVVSANLERDTRSTEDSLCDWIQLHSVSTGLAGFQIENRPLRVQPHI